MPTGYTAKLCQQDVAFNDFVMTCARAMGACVMMREEPFDAPIPERFEPSDYHAKKLAEAEVELERVSGLSDAECEVEAAAEYASEKERLEAYVAKAIEAGTRLRAMQKQVRNWTPPTPDHIGLKDFMREQLASTLQFDGDPKYARESLAKLRRKTPNEWRLEKIAKAQKDIDYHHAEHLDEVKRTEARNDWLKALRESLAEAQP